MLMLTLMLMLEWRILKVIENDFHKLGYCRTTIFQQATFLRLYSRVQIAYKLLFQNALNKI